MRSSPIPYTLPTAARRVRIVAGGVLGLLLLIAAETGRLVGQPPATPPVVGAQPPAKAAAAKPGALPPLNQAAVDEAIARGVEYLRATQNGTGIWGDGNGKDVGGGGGWAVAYTALAGIALIESGARLNDSALTNAAAIVRAGSPHLVDTYEIALAIIFLDRMKDPKRDGQHIRTLAARLIAGQTVTGGWKYQVPKLVDNEANAMLVALRKMTPPPPTIRVSYRERPSSLGLCIKASDDIIVKPTQASLDADELEKKRVSAVATLPANLKKVPAVLDPEKVRSIDKRDLQDTDKGDNSNTHFATIGLWAARRHDVPTERAFALLAHRFRSSQDSGGGGWGYSYPQSGSAPAMTCVALLGLAIGHALAVDPEAAARPQLDPAIVKALLLLGKNVGAPNGEFANKQKVKDVGGLYYLWALERIAVLYDLPTLDNKDWYRWGAEILIANQLADGSWKDAMVHGDNPIVDTALAVLFLKRANLTPDLSKRLILDSTALTAKVVETPKVEPPPPPPPKIDLSGLFPTEPAPKQPEPTPAPPETKTQAAPPSEPAVAKKESAPLWPWLVGGLGVLAVLGLGLFFALRKKSDDDEEDDDEEEEEKPKKKGKSAAKAVKAKRSRAKE